MVMSMLIALIGIILPGGVDNGLIQTSWCPSGLAFPTLPLDIYSDSSVGVDYAQGWWNDSPLAAEVGGPVFNDGTLSVGTNFVLVEDLPNVIVVLPSVFGSYGAVFHQLDTNDQSGCTILNAFIISPDINLPDAEGYLVLLLGYAMGLEHDQYAFSVMDPRLLTQTRLSSRTTEITQADIDRLLDRIVQ